MRRVVITGAPGVGKTTLLNEFAAMGYPVVDESARAIIAERIASGSSPRPSPLSFAQEILRRDIEKYRAQPKTSNWVFFDRGAIEAVGMVHEVSPFTQNELQAMLATYPFHSPVFILPPWEDIYTNDRERDQSFADALQVHATVVDWYRLCGYSLHEVPRVSAKERAIHVLQVLSDADA